MERQVGDREAVEPDVLAELREVRDAARGQRPPGRGQVAERELQAISQAR